MPVLAPVNHFWSDNLWISLSLNPWSFQQWLASFRLHFLPSPPIPRNFWAVSSMKGNILKSIHSWKLERWVLLGPEQITPNTKTPDVPTTVSSVLSRSRATNTTTSTSFRDSLPSCSQCWGTSQTALSMVRTGLRVFSSKVLGKILLHLQVFSSLHSGGGKSAQTSETHY